MYGTYVPYYKLGASFKHSKFPVFALNQIHIGEGVLGGYMVNPYEQGMIAAQKAFEIIDGKKPFTQSRNPKIPTILIMLFCVNIIFRLATYLRNQPSLMDLIVSMKSIANLSKMPLLLMPLLLLLTTILVLNIVKRISLEKRVTAFQNRLDNVLLNNIQSAIFWKSNDGIIVDAMHCCQKF